MTIYEKISKLRELNEVFKKENFNSEFTQLIDDIATYAEDCYVSDAEDIGYDIINNVEIIEERSYEKGKKDCIEKAFVEGYKYAMLKAREWVEKESASTMAEENSNDFLNYMMYEGKAIR